MNPEIFIEEKWKFKTKQKYVLKVPRAKTFLTFFKTIWTTLCAKSYWKISPPLTIESDFMLNLNKIVKNGCFITFIFYFKKKSSEPFDMFQRNLMLLSYFAFYSNWITCEQRPPVNNGQFESSTASLNLSFIRHLCKTAAFFRSQGWPLYTGLTVSTRVGNK